MENRVVQLYENNIIATTTQPLIEANRRCNESLRALQAENHELNDRNEELVNVNMVLEGSLFEMKKKVEKQVKTTDYMVQTIDKFPTLCLH